MTSLFSFHPFNFRLTNFIRIYLLRKGSRMRSATISGSFNLKIKAYILIYDAAVFAVTCFVYIGTLRHAVAVAAGTRGSGMADSICAWARVPCCGRASVAPAERLLLIAALLLVVCYACRSSLCGYKYLILLCRVTLAQCVPRARCVIFCAS